MCECFACTGVRQSSVLMFRLLFRLRGPIGYRGDAGLTPSIGARQHRGSNLLPARIQNARSERDSQLHRHSGSNPQARIRNARGERDLLTPVHLPLLLPTLHGHVEDGVESEQAPSLNHVRRPHLLSTLVVTLQNHLKTGRQKRGRKSGRRCGGDGTGEKSGKKCVLTGMQWCAARSVHERLRGCLTNEHL